ncbi:MAG: DUF6340 family protein [Bacteroidales bacterium]|jgi:hypothetical protein|nr:DUF6340 family protein [Bacteroidales bacterium]
MDIISNVMICRFFNGAIVVASLALFFSACAPVRSYMDVDVKVPVENGVDFNNKTVAIFTVTPGDSLDSLLINKVAVGLASKMEEDSGTDSSMVDVYAIPENKFVGLPSMHTGVGGSVDTLGHSIYYSQMMLKTGADAQIILSGLRFSDFIPGENDFDDVITLFLPYSVNVDIYDALNDKLLFFKKISDTMTVNISTASTNRNEIERILHDNLSIISGKIGESLSGYFMSYWAKTNIMLINYYDHPEWNSPYTKARNFMWDKAIEEWMPLTELKNNVKASFAAYNIAVGCQMLGKFDLGIKWVNISLQKYKFSESFALKQQLEKLKSYQSHVLKENVK